MQAIFITIMYNIDSRINFINHHIGSYYEHYNYVLCPNLYNTIPLCHKP